MLGRRSDDDFRSLRERWREHAWPLAAGVVVAFVLAESLDDANGGKSLTALLVSAAAGAVVYGATFWFRH